MSSRVVVPDPIHTKECSMAGGVTQAPFIFLQAPSEGCASKKGDGGGGRRTCRTRHGTGRGCHGARSTSFGVQRSSRFRRGTVRALFVQPRHHATSRRLPPSFFNLARIRSCAIAFLQLLCLLTHHWRFSLALPPPNFVMISAYHVLNFGSASQYRHCSTIHLWNGLLVTTPPAPRRSKINSCY